MNHLDILYNIFGSIIAIVLAIIIGLIIYIKIPCQIIYVLKRVGNNEKVFKPYKFRSMINNTNIYKKALAIKNRSNDGLMFKVENNSRFILGIGRLIRKTSIDEFLQFFSVLKRDMSLVGIRSLTLNEWEKYSPCYRSRLSIKPGIIGLSQTSGRLNIADINSGSISLDIKKTARTIFQIFSKKNGSM